MPAVFGAHAVSMLGTVAAQVALSILIYERTGSPLLSALVLACSFLPYAVAGVAFSSITDRLPTKPVLVGCDLLSAVCIGLMLVPAMPVAGLLGLLLLTGLIAPVFAGARAASLAELLPAELFSTGRSLLRAISQVTVLLGFAVGAVAVAAIGPAWLLALDVVSFVASAVLIAFATPGTGARLPASRSAVQDSLDGLRYVFGDRRLRLLVPLTWVAAGFASIPDGLAVAYTAGTGAAASAAGALLAGYSAGTVLGELVVARLAARTRRRLVVPLLCASQLPAICFVVEPSLPLATILLAISGSGFAFNQGIDPLILDATDPAYRGRLFTVQTSGLMAVQGVTIATAGAVGTVLAPHLTITFAAVLGTVITLTLAHRALRALPTPVNSRSTELNSIDGGCERSA